ncbi:hypothetical protein GOBAR_DD33646 [Gossypium barbadense]|nr:hypothetical protein GOBAR_DD33646 [Gossypium barbadense]
MPLGTSPKGRWVAQIHRTRADHHVRTTTTQICHINQGSIDGANDTKIAMGAYQPYRLSTKEPAVEEYWNLYACKSLDNKLLGHLLSYPIGVSSDGEVKELAGLEYFSDTKGRVLGPKSGSFLLFSLPKFSNLIV